MLVVMLTDLFYKFLEVSEGFGVRKRFDLIKIFLVIVLWRRMGLGV